MLRQREDRYENRRLLDLAHEMPCMVDEPHECTYDGCVPMHSDWSIFGRGGWHKSHDFAFAAGCPPAHKILTAQVGDEMERERKRLIWLRAHVRTMFWIWTHGKIRLA